MRPFEIVNASSLCSKCIFVFDHFYEFFINSTKIDLPYLIDLIWLVIMEREEQTCIYDDDLIKYLCVVSMLPQASIKWGKHGCWLSRELQ